MNYELSDAQLENELKKISEIEKITFPFKNYEGKDEVIEAQEMKGDISLEPTRKYYTSLSKLNETIDGFKGGDLVTVSGISGNGKTELLVSFTKDFIDRGYKPLWISFEVSARDFIGRFGDYDLAFYIPKENKAGDLKWLFARIYEAKAKYGIDMVIIDHLHFLVPFEKLRSGNDSLLFGSIIREIKTQALLLDVTIFLVAHLKKVERDTCPDLADLRDSSFTYQEADTVLIVHRTDKDGQIDNSSNITDAVLRVAKNRWKGMLGLIKLKYNRAHRRFYGTEITD
jgi:replicative DNA helicase